MPQPISRRFLLKNSAAISLGVSSSDLLCAGDQSSRPDDILPDNNTCLTPADDFFTVARGNPKPHSLTGEDLVNARMTPESWRLEIGVDDEMDPPIVHQKPSVEKRLSIAEGTALTFQSLLQMGQNKSVKLIKAIQCLNINTPLGQGLWEGVPLRDVLRLCGNIRNVRRVFFWGFHNNDPKQIFQSSLSYTQAVDHASNEPPVFLAYRLNGRPISPIRGGPVRMIVPWAYGFKSIKWLQKIMLSNDPRSNDTYSNQNNDPDSPIKTAAYLAKETGKNFKNGLPLKFFGVVISGLSGVSEIQYLVRAVDSFKIKLPPDHPEITGANWKPAEIDPPPESWNAALPRGQKPNDLFGFNPTSGMPLSWPIRYGMSRWTASVQGLKPGKYEFRVRSVDENGFAQPEPRPLQKSGRNAVPIHFFTVN